MPAILRLLAVFIANLFKSRRRLEADTSFFRHQLNIALRRRPARLPLRGSDRVLLVWMTWLWPSLLGMVQVVEPVTILRWHRAVAPENFILPDLHGEGESAHHQVSWSRSSVCLQRLSPTCSNRDVGLKRRSSASVISSISP